jgi:hypothetical protein
MQRYEKKALPLPKYFAPISKDKYVIRVTHLCSQHICAATNNYTGTAFHNTVRTDASPEIQVLT